MKVTIQKIIAIFIIGMIILIQTAPTMLAISQEIEGQIKQEKIEDLEENTVEEETEKEEENEEIESIEPKENQEELMENEESQEEAIIEENKTMPEEEITKNSIEEKIGTIDDSGELGIAYQAYIDQIGTSEWKLNDDIGGTENQGIGINGLRIQLTNAPTGAGVEYQVLADGSNGKEWSNWLSDGQLAGKEENGKNIYAIKIRLKNMNQYSVEYQIHRKYQGWENRYVSDGEIGGTENTDSRLEGIRIRIVPKIKKTVGIEYKAYVDKKGLQEWTKNDNLAGSENQGIGLNGLRIRLTNAPTGAGVEYQVLIDGANGREWTNWLMDGQLGGYEENNKNIYAIKIRLKNMNYYSVEYKIHRKYQGWEEKYVSDGEIGGTEHTDSRIEGIKIRIVPKIEKTVGIEYKGYVDKQGIQEWTKNDSLAGNENKGIGLNSIRIQLTNAPTGAGVEYQVLVDGTDRKEWTGWLSDGQLAGYEENNKNIYAIRIRLKNMDNYSVEYRIHRKYQGWENRYVADGEIAGTETTNSRLEGIRIRIVPKNRKTVSVEYKAYIDKQGTQEWCENDGLAGSENKGIGLNGLRIYLTGAPTEAGIEYQVLIDGTNKKEWTGWLTDGQLAGYEENNKNIYAIRIRLKNMDNYSIEYRIHRKYQGWEASYAADGEIAGTEYTNSRLEGIRIRIVPKGKKIGIEYKGYVDNKGLQEWMKNGNLVGTEDKGIGLNGLKIQLTGAPTGAGIEYKALVDGTNGKEWTEWLSDGQLVGYEENNKNIYAIRIRLKNMNQYSVEYRIHRKYQGWESNYVADGEIAGTEYTNSRLEGIKIRIVPKGNNKVLGIEYKAYVDEQGPQEWTSNNNLAGTENRGMGLSGLRIQLTGAPTGAKVEYQALIDDVSKKEWTDWLSDGQLVGYEESNKNIYAIRIRLKNMDNYSVEYKIHRKYQGWETNYVCDGETAGTEHTNSRLEGIRIRIVPKGNKPVGIEYKGYVDKQGLKEWTKNNNLAGTENKGIGLNGLRIRLTGASTGGSLEYQVLVDGTNGKKSWTNWVTDGELAGFEENGKNMYAIRIRLKNMDNYSVEYKIHRKYQGWETSYACDGETAGIETADSRIEGIKIRIVPKGNKTVGIEYQAYVDKQGLKEWTRNGNLAGTENKGMGLNGLRVRLTGAPTGGSLEYQALVDGSRKRIAFNRSFC